MEEKSLKSRNAIKTFPLFLKNYKQLDISGKKKFIKQECNRNIPFISVKIISSWIFQGRKKFFLSRNATETLVIPEKKNKLKNQECIN